MVSILLAYATGEGQTANVASVVAETLEARGHDVHTVDVTRRPPDLDASDFDAVLVGASIHVGKHQPAIVSFVDDAREALADRPSGFFQVSLSAALPDEASRAQAAQYVEDLLAKTGWEPDRIGSFGGALRYSEYGFLTRAIVKRIAKGTTGDTDTSRDYEYTDWAEVEAFAADFADELDTAAGDLDGGLPERDLDDTSPLDEGSGTPR